MSYDTKKLRDLHDHLVNELYKIPTVAMRTSYAKFVTKMLNECNIKLQESIEMDEDKSHHRCN